MEMCKSVGWYRNPRAKNAQTMFRHNDGKFPQNYEKYPNTVSSKQSNYEQIYIQNYYSEIIKDSILKLENKS